jgi:hypothetical protein
MQRKRLALGSGYNNIYLHESKVSKFSGFGFGNFDVAVTVPMSRRTCVKRATDPGTLSAPS